MLQRYKENRGTRNRLKSFGTLEKQAPDEMIRVKLPPKISKADVLSMNPIAMMKGLS